MSRICIDARKIGDFGIGSYTSELLAALSGLASGHTFLVLAHPSRRRFVESLGTSFLHIETSAREYSVGEQVAISRLLRRHRAALFHALHYVLPASLPCPTVATVHDIIHLLYPRFLPHRLAGIYARRMIGRTLRRADRIIAVSESTRRDLGRLDPDADAKIRVVYNGVAETFRSSDGEAPLPIEGPYFLFVGNPKPHKNLANLLRAWRRARGALPEEIRLVCVGARDGPPAELLHLRSKLGLDRAVVFLDHVGDAELASLYRGAIALVHPSLYEGFGLPVAEAMASATPVITSASSAMQEVAGDAALLVDPLDLHQIADAIVEVAGNAELRADLGVRGARRISAFTWPRAARETLEVYEEVLAGVKG